MNKEDKLTAIQFLNDAGAFLITNPEIRLQIISESPNIHCTVILM